MDYPSAIKFLQSFPDMERGTAPIDNLAMSLESMKSLLARLQDPNCGRNTVHVAGSKGKGSTSTMIASILQKTGSKTALYTSPHLHSYRERIQIDSSAVSEKTFALALDAMRQAVENEHQSGNGPIVTFGILTALFFEIARREECRWQVVEVGLGGTEDATNVFTQKQVAVITPISVEHSAILGKTPAEIAKHKCGIITSGSTAVLAAQQDPLVKPVVEERCNTVGAKLIDVQALYASELRQQDWQAQSGLITGPNGSLPVTLTMLGSHQLRNAATAMAVAHALRENGFEMSDDSIAEGLACAHLPGRLEVLSRQPAVVVDGAHNGESARVLRLALDQLFPNKRRIMVIGVNRDKDIGSILEELAPAADCVIATRSGNARSMDPAQIAQHPMARDMSAATCGSAPEAIAKALSLAGKDDLICITGSLYLVAEAREHLLKIEQIV